MNSDTCTAVQWHAIMTRRAERSYLGQERYDLSGCCGYHEYRYSIDVETVGESGSLLKRETIVRCDLLGRECKAAAAAEAAERWSHFLEG